MPEKIIFVFENLAQSSMKAAGLHEHRLVGRGTVRQIWENLLDWVADKDALERLRATEDRIQFSTQKTGHSQRQILMWHETPAAEADMIYAYYPMSLRNTTSLLTQETMEAAEALLALKAGVAASNGHQLPPLDNDLLVTVGAAPTTAEKVKKE
jgi:hypothetical protein